MASQAQSLLEQASQLAASRDALREANTQQMQHSKLAKRQRDIEEDILKILDQLTSLLTVLALEQPPLMPTSQGPTPMPSGVSQLKL